MEEGILWAILLNQRHHYTRNSLCMCVCKVAMNQKLKRKTRDAFWPLASDYKRIFNYKVHRYFSECLCVLLTFLLDCSIGNVHLLAFKNPISSQFIVSVSALWQAGKSPDIVVIGKWTLREVNKPLMAFCCDGLLMDIQRNPKVPSKSSPLQPKEIFLRCCSTSITLHRKNSWRPLLYSDFMPPGSVPI